MSTAILAYSRTKYFFYAYYVLRTLIAMTCEGSVEFLALAYVVILILEEHKFCVGIFSDQLVLVRSVYYVPKLRKICDFSFILG